MDSCIINKYEKGQGISPHIDNLQFGPYIVCFSFGSGIEINFDNENETKKIYVNNNSVYIMSGDSRYKYKHSIQPRQYDILDGIKIERKTRYSITFRSVNKF